MSQLELSIIFKASKPEDISVVTKLLQEQNLPTGGIEDQFENFILVFTHNSEFVGCGGLELYGDYGLVRSMAIRSEFQNKKIGSKLINQIEKVAKDNNIKQLYLLTETAERFFSKHGYSTIERINIPESISNTYEYSVACKQSAIVMSKNLQNL